MMTWFSMELSFFTCICNLTTVCLNSYNCFMQAQIRNYNFLIVGKSGAGKSATTRLLTGNPHITVANSLRQVTKQACFYEGTSFNLNGHLVKFRILDVPGLDKINNRFVIREQILSILQKEKISLHGILYISSLTQRDTIDSEKLFKFIEQLPWPNQVKRNCLIPVLTKYDNLIIDSLDEQIRSTKLEYKQIFEKAGYASAWSKRVYWINHTKSLDFKMKTYQQIKITHQKQVERLVEMIHRSKVVLTQQQIVSSIEKEERFILSRLFGKMEQAKLPYNIQSKRYSLTAQIQIQQKKVYQSMTALSASSIGLFITKVLQRQIPTIYSVALMGLPIAIALLTMKGTSSVLHGKKISQQSSGVQLLQTYQRLCHLINLQVQNQWKQLNNMIDLRAGEENLYCIISGQKKFKFIDLTQLKIIMDEEQFESVDKKMSVELTEGQSQSQKLQEINNKSNQKNIIFKKYKIKIPKFQTQTIWQPTIQFQYGVRIFDQNSILKEIQNLRQDYYENMSQQ